MYITVFCNFAYFYHCLAISQACLLFDCYYVSYLPVVAFFFSYCSCFSFNCYIVIIGLCFSCYIYSCLCLLQQFSIGSSDFFSFLLKSFLRSFFQYGKGLVYQSSDLFLEYITDTFYPLTLKSGLEACFKAWAAYSGVKNSTKAKSFNWPVILFLIIRISLTEQMDQNKSSKISSSVSIITGPRIIRLQLLIFSSLVVLALALFLVGTTDDVLQLNLQLLFFQLSQRQHLFLRAKFLYSHLSQYQSYAIFKSIFLQGQKLILYSVPFITIFYFSNSFIFDDTSTEGYFIYIAPYFNYTSSGTLVPAVMLASVNARQAAYCSVQFSILRVFVYSILNRGYWDTCDYYFLFPNAQLLFLLLWLSLLPLFGDYDEQCLFFFFGLESLCRSRPYLPSRLSRPFYPPLQLQ